MTDKTDNTLDVFDDRAQRILEDTDYKKAVKIYDDTHIQYLLARSRDEFRSNPRRTLFPKGTKND